MVVVQRQICQTRQPLDVREPPIGKPVATDAKLLEVRQVGKHRQAGVGHFRGIDIPAKFRLISFYHRFDPIPDCQDGKPNLS
jgi:hypothetical protein